MNRTVKSAMVGSAVMLALAIWSGASIAESMAPEERAFRGKSEIADASLADMRGRFISAELWVIIAQVWARAAIFLKQLFVSYVMAERIMTLS